MIFNNKIFTILSPYRFLLYYYKQYNFFVPFGVDVNMFTYHRSSRDGVPFEPECDKRRRNENDARDEESREIKRSITCED